MRHALCIGHADAGPRRACSQLVVMQRGYGVWGEAGTHRAEEHAFWTFAAIMEVVLPADFYHHPHMPGLQRDVRVLFHLFELARSDDRAPVLELEGSGQWRDILRLAAYRWFVPCFVNMLPLATLLLYWDRLFLRGGGPPPAAPPPVSNHASQTAHGGAPTQLAGHHGRGAGHLLLAIALIRTAIAEAAGEAGDEGGGEAGDTALGTARPEEGLFLGFHSLLEAGQRQTDAAALLALASTFEVSPAQLCFLRARLEEPPPPAAASSAADGSSGAGSRRKQPRPPEPVLSALQTTALSLMSPRPTDPMPVRLLKQTLLLSSPPPPPVPAMSHMRFYYPRLVSTCTVTGVACVVWAARVLLGGGRAGLLDAAAGDV